MGLEREAAAIENAVDQALAAGCRTGDLARGSSGAQDARNDGGDLGIFECRVSKRIAHAVEKRVAQA